MASSFSRTSNSARFNQLGSALRASRASMASIAESAGTQDDLLDEEGFSPRAIVCHETPESSPKDSSAKQAPPLPVARV
jgi:hypothetical protein